MGILESIKAVLSDKENRLNIIIIVSIFLFALSLRLFGVMDVGLTYDEPIYVTAGVAYIDAVSGSPDYTQDMQMVNKEHPPLSKYIYRLVHSVMAGGAPIVKVYKKV